MSRLRALLVLGCLVGLSVPSESKAFAISGGGDFWNESIGNGAGLNLYPQWDVGYGLTPELQVGAHWVRDDLGVTNVDFLYIPAMIGLRFDLGGVIPLGILGPFVGAHLGYARIEALSGGQSGGSDNFAYNFVAGLNIWLGNTVGIGVQGGYDMIAQDAQHGGNVEIGSIAAILTLH